MIILCKYKLIIRKLLRYVKSRLVILIWFFPGLWYFIFSKKLNRNRILIIYDLKSQPFSIGDLLTFQMASLVLKSKYDCKHIDFALIGNPSQIIQSTHTFKNIDSENYFFHLAGILPVIQVNPFLGSLFAFSSMTELEEYILSSISKTHIWPTKWQIEVSREYLYYEIIENILFPFYSKNNYLPCLESRKPLQQWARTFLKSQLKDEIAITVNLRNNPHYQIERNANISSWVSFFKWALDNKFPAKFFVICASTEVDTRFRSINNVVIIRDFNTNIENDLALVEQASFHMGVASGPSAMAFFSNKPYAIFRAEFDKQYFKNNKIIKFQQNDRIQKLFFANEFQFFVSGEENVLDIIKYFKILWDSIAGIHVDQDELLTIDEKYKLINWLR